MGWGEAIANERKDSTQTQEAKVKIVDKVNTSVSYATALLPRLISLRAGTRGKKQRKKSAMKKECKRRNTRQRTQLEQVMILAVDIAANGNGAIDGLDITLFHQNLSSLLTQAFNLLLGQGSTTLRQELIHKAIQIAISQLDGRSGRGGGRGGGDGSGSICRLGGSGIGGGGSGSGD